MKEMAQRIAAHRQARPDGWQTVEAPRRVAAALSTLQAVPDALLLDCLTLLVSNILLAMETQPQADIEAAIQAELEAILTEQARLAAPLIVVSNEVGLGLVPTYALGRLYRDILGRANQFLAAQANQVIFIVTGIPLLVKAENKMISLSLAKELKAAGLSWMPAQNDFFVVPDREMDEAVFVISDMTVLVETVNGQLAVTFHGTSEWALDHVILADLVWLPTETQLRDILEQRLLGEVQPALILFSTVDGYGCEINFGGEQLRFETFGASEAYALALLHILKHR